MYIQTTVPKWVLLMVVFGTSAWAQTSGTSTSPSYSSESIFNAANNLTGPFAPNVLVTIRGKYLAWVTEGVDAQLSGNLLPNKLAGVQVYGGTGNPLPLLYVASDEIRLLLPPSLDPGPLGLRVMRQGVAGPAVKIELKPVAPTFFELDGNVLAAHLDGTVVSPDSPAAPGEVIVLYATGLGPVPARLRDGETPEIPPFNVDALALSETDDLIVSLAGEAVDPAAVLWAGLAPGFTGVYQINLQLPETLPADPEIRIAIGGEISREGLPLAARRPEPPAPEELPGERRR